MQLGSRNPGPTRTLNRCVAYLCLLVGAGSMLAWHFGFSFVVRLPGTTSPLHYNTALETFLLGLAFLLSERKGRRIGCVVLSFAGILIAALTLAEYMIPVQLGIDELAALDWLTQPPLFPGRPSPNSAVCCILINVAFLMRIWFPPSFARSLVKEILGSIVFAVAITAVLGHLSGIPSAYAWGSLTQMALQPALIFTVLGMSATVGAWLTDPSRQTSQPTSMGMPIFLSLFAFTIALSYALSCESRGAKARILDQISARIGSAAQFYANRTFAMVEAIGDQHHRKPLDINSVQNILREESPDIISVATFDTQHGLKWIYQRLRDRTSAERIELTDEVIAPLLTNDKPESGLRVSAPFMDSHRRWSTLVLYPTHETNGQVGSATLAQIDLSRAMTITVTRIIPRAFYCAVRIGHHWIYTNETDTGSVDWRFRQETPLHVSALMGSVTVAPSIQWSKNTDSYLPLVVLFSGTLISILVALVAQVAVAARKRQVQMEIANSKLLSEIGRREEMEGELRQAKEAADKANGSKTIFLANISHELRTPLGIIEGFTQLISNDSLTAEERHDFLERIRTNTRSLTSLIDDLLDLTKVETGQFPISLKEFSLREFFSVLISSFEVKAKQKRLNLVFIQEGLLPTKVLSDESRLRQILNNLIGNAIKFTQMGTVTVTISCEETEREPKGLLRMRIRDSGVGLADIHRNRIFRAFGQADDTISAQHGGTGLGLLLSRQLARKMGGDVVLLESAPQVGSLFEAKVAYGKVQSSTREANILNSPTPESTTPQESRFKASAAINRKALAGVRILIVEDAPDNQLLFKQVLQRVGGTIAIANDGREGVQKAMDEEFDVILMDLQMPNLDGYQATSLLRSRGFGKPIIALTAHAMLEEKDRCLASGFSGYLTKPVHFETLIRTLEKSVQGMRTSPLTRTPPLLGSA